MCPLSSADFSTSPVGSRIRTAPLATGERINRLKIDDGEARDRGASSRHPPVQSSKRHFVDTDSRLDAMGPSRDMTGDSRHMNPQLHPFSLTFGPLSCNVLPTEVSGLVCYGDREGNAFGFDGRP